MAYIKLRLTPEKYHDTPSFNWTFGKFIPDLINYLGIYQYTWGCEETDKFGKPTLAHVHIHGMYDIDKNVDTLRSHMRKFSQQCGFKFGGNKCYSLSLLADPEDEDRFMRYPLKKQDYSKIAKKHKGGGVGINDETLEKWELLARDEYKIQKAKNLQALENHLDKSSFKGKMFSEFNEEEIDTHKSFVIELIKYYQKKNKVPPFSKIEDYWVDYRISVGLLTAEEWYDLKYNFKKKVKKIKSKLHV